MKKYILVLGVFLVFGAYVIYSHKGGDDVNIVAPAGLTLPAAISSSSASADTSAVAAGGSAPPPAQTTAPTPAVTTPIPAKQPTPTPAAPQGQYKDGSYTSPVADAYFGNLQIQAVVSGGKLTDVVFLQYPNDNGHSQQVSQQALPYLKAEAIQAQSANVNIISGATQTSQAFQQALATVLSQAKN